MNPYSSYQTADSPVPSSVKVYNEKHPSQYGCFSIIECRSSNSFSVCYDKRWLRRYKRILPRFVTNATVMHRCCTYPHLFIVVSVI